MGWGARTREGRHKQGQNRVPTHRAAGRDLRRLRGPDDVPGGCGERRQIDRPRRGPGCCGPPRAATLTIHARSDGYFLASVPVVVAALVGCDPLIQRLILF
jgi:hypothetical protein